MQKNHIDFQQTKKFMNKIDFLDGVQRKELLPPEDILDRLSINKSDSILDVGAVQGS